MYALIIYQFQDYISNHICMIEIFQERNFYCVVYIQSQVTATASYACLFKAFYLHLPPFSKIRDYYHDRWCTFSNSYTVTGMYAVMVEARIHAYSGYVWEQFL